MANRKYRNEVQHRKAVRAQQNAYKKRAFKAYTFKFHKQHDRDIINKLDSVSNRVDYVRQLIRRD